MRIHVSRILCALIAMMTAFAVLLSTGCGSNDAKNAESYVQYMLDGLTTGNFDESKLPRGLEILDDPAQAREDMLNAVTEELGGLSGQAASQVQNAFNSILGASRITVGSAAADGDSYAIPLTVEPLNLVMDSVESERLLIESARGIDLLDENAEQAFNDAATSTIFGYLGNLAKNASYGDPIDIIVHVDKNADGVLDGREADFEALGESLYTVSNATLDASGAQQIVGLYTDLLGSQAPGVTNAVADALVYMQAFSILPGTGLYEEDYDRIGAFVDTIKSILGHTNYEVGEAIADGENFIVPVQISVPQWVDTVPTDTLGDSAYTALVENGYENITEDLISAEAFAQLLEQVPYYIDNSTYLDPVSVDVHVVKDADGAYTIDEDDFTTLFFTPLA